jgi:hypothetical protein
MCESDCNSVIEWAPPGNENKSTCGGSWNSLSSVTASTTSTTTTTTTTTLHRCKPRVTDYYNLRHGEDAADEDADAENCSDVVIVVIGKSSPGATEPSNAYVERLSNACAERLSNACAERLSNAYAGRDIRSICTMKKNPPVPKGGSSMMPRWVKAVLVGALVGMIAVASLAIRHAVVEDRFEGNRPTEGGTRGIDGGESWEQELLEMAERVIVACGEGSLDRDMR